MFLTAERGELINPAFIAITEETKADIGRRCQSRFAFSSSFFGCDMGDAELHRFSSNSIQRDNSFLTLSRFNRKNAERVFRSIGGHWWKKPFKRSYTESGNGQTTFGYAGFAPSDIGDNATNSPFVAVLLSSSYGFVGKKENMFDFQLRPTSSNRHLFCGGDVFSEQLRLAGDIFQGADGNYDSSDTDAYQEQIEDPTSPVCPISSRAIYRHGGKLADNYGIAIIVGMLLAAVALGWPIAICFIRGWRCLSWCLIGCALALDIAGCLSGIIGCLPCDWWTCLHDGQEDSQRKELHSGKIVPVMSDSN